MLNNITLGQYIPGDTVIHRLDPRCKLLGTICLIAAIFTASGILSYALMAGLVIAAAKSANISFKVLLRSVRPILFIVIITFILNILFTSGEDTIIDWAFIHISQKGILTAVRLAVRLVLLVMSTQLLTLTTSPISLTDGMERLMSPLARIHFPAHEISMMISIAMRFIPTLMEEADKIMKAQTSRGADFEGGSLLKRAKAMLPLLVPLFLSAFRRADELALAMEARCYRGGKGRTRMHPLRYTKNDLSAELICAGSILACILLNHVF